MPPCDQSGVAKTCHPPVWKNGVTTGATSLPVNCHALVVATEGGGREARFVGSPSGLWDGTGGALALAPWALAQQRERARVEDALYSLRGEAGFGMDVMVSHPSDETWTMGGAVRWVSDGRVVT